MPSTCLIPLADMLNHSKYSTEHYIFNRTFEEDFDKQPREYKAKKRTYDFSVIDGFNP
jgi:hypothetical protein